MSHYPHEWFSQCYTVRSDRGKGEGGLIPLPVVFASRRDRGRGRGNVDLHRQV